MCQTSCHSISRFRYPPTIKRFVGSLTSSLSPTTTSWSAPHSAHVRNLTYLCLSYLFYLLITAQSECMSYYQSPNITELRMFIYVISVNLLEAVILCYLHWNLLITISRGIGNRWNTRDKPILRFPLPILIPPVVPRSFIIIIRRCYRRPNSDRGLNGVSLTSPQELKREGTS
jgi:hypothetical protein